jgi:hypothetical protein
MNIPYHFAPAYKYCSVSTLSKIVLNGRIRFTRADAFNDVFELSPFLLPLDWNGVAQLAEADMQTAKTIASTAFDKVCSSLYISCFSKNYISSYSQLMWAHYGDAHQGVCFCVDFSILHDSLDAKGYYPVEVRYAKSLLHERNRLTQDSPELGLLIGATKSDVWSYEEEVRILIECDSFDSSKYEKVSDGKYIDVVFNPKCISKVIFGMKSQRSDVELVAKSFCGIGHIPDLTRLDVDPLTLQVVEKHLGLKENILEKNANKIT